MSFARWILGLPLAALATAILVLMMAGLIRQDFTPGEQRDPPDLRITPQIEPQPVQPRKFTPPELRNAPPPPDTRDPRKQELEGGVPTGPIELGPREIPDIGVRFGGATIRPTPAYPEGCRAKGAEGSVIVQFDVTAEGNVTNVRIVSSPDRCFDRAVIRAVSGWKYPPAEANGRAVPRRDVVERLSFVLEDE